MEWTKKKEEILLRNENKVFTNTLSYLVEAWLVVVEIWLHTWWFFVSYAYRQARETAMARLIADEFLTDERDRKYYADHYRCLPPPLFIISVTLIELGFFTYYTVWHGEISSSGPLPMDSPFVYRPDKRQEVWRFLFYMVLHAGWVHLMFNLLVQLLVGLPLEMVHGSLRIGCVYMAGVLAGSLGTSVFDPDVYLVGASGGVYALLAAHLANVLLNYNNMEFGLVRLLGVFLIASVDVGFAIYDRYAASPPSEGSVPPVSYVAHLTGALAGLTIGLLVLKNFEQKLREQLMWWFALGYTEASRASTNCGKNLVSFVIKKMAMSRRPRLIVFDLDFTLWPFWVDGSGFTHVRAPFCKKKGKVVDSWGKIINISGEIYEILKYLKTEDFRIGVASATRQIDGAEELIHHFGWDEFIDYKQIYPGSKLRHFSRLKEMSDCEYHEMLFFDDDIRFVEEVRSLGKTSTTFERSTEPLHVKCTSTESRHCTHLHKVQN
ncbi:unnamed protein product [Allacma fusca]|uniref:Peptidase S54 rhomboid domain-containing protein n=1 Tax=Allacma fusca TaxID=39272 RepID=A0A8J2NRV8_9HEXA|nr:unnamed protein product [Allacma fusca]